MAAGNGMLPELTLVQGDITRQRVDAIANAANEGLVGGGGVDGAIHRAGGASIMAECDRIRRERGGCPTGTAVITTAGDLPAKVVIHTAGPRWRGGSHGEAELLASCYRSCLDLAERGHYRTIAFPSISTGIYGYPIQEAARVAIATVGSRLTTAPGRFDEVRFVLFSPRDLAVYAAARNELGY
jgi:O-acetyl-ADP-ribose deacetylase (regulator of RNase III)